VVTKVVGGLGAAIGCRFLRQRNQLVFVEYSKGAIALLDRIRPLDSIVSQGATVLKGTWVFDLETGAQHGSLGDPGDVWWEQVDPVQRKMVPVAGAGIVNLGPVSWASVTPNVLQALAYGTVSIPGNNDASNQLVDGDVFAVRTNAGNLAKVRVVHYGYNMDVEWVTYKLASPYHCIGLGYHTPEDIAVCADEQRAYVTERTGNLLRVNLAHADRAAAVVVASGMTAPHQIYLDEGRGQAYVAEYADPGRLFRIDLATGAKTVLLSNLHNSTGLLISADLAYAYVTEQTAGGRITRYSLQGGAPLVIASGITSPFFLTWVDAGQTALFVANRDPANAVSIVETVPHAGSVRQVVTGTGVRPSSVALVDAEHLLICCDQEIDEANLLAGSAPLGLFKGIGLVPWNLITAAGMANTTTEPGYPYQFAANSPFGGVLSLQVNHGLAWLSGVRYYRILVDGGVRLETWSDLKLNLANGKYEILVTFTPATVAGKKGCYAVHQPGDWYMNTDLGMILNSASLPNGLHQFRVEFLNAAGALLQTHVQDILLNNSPCTAAIEMPVVGGVSATTECGMLKYANLAQNVTIVYTADHPELFGTYSWRLGRAGKGPVPGVPECVVDGVVSHSPFTFAKSVAALLGACANPPHTGSAAFYAAVYVYAKAVNGYGRLSQYDASAIVAFALTP
jgi:hypothetical protein